MQEPDGRARANPAQQETTGAASSKPGGGLFVVSVSQSCSETLTGHGAVQYVSPPQPLEAARSLVALMCDRNHLDEIAVGEYAVAVAGGRRTIKLEAAR